MSHGENCELSSLFNWEFVPAFRSHLFCVLQRRIWMMKFAFYMHFCAENEGNLISFFHWNLSYLILWNLYFILFFLYQSQFTSRHEMWQYILHDMSNQSKHIILVWSCFTMVCWGLMGCLYVTNVVFLHNLISSRAFFLHLIKESTHKQNLLPDHTKNLRLKFWLASRPQYLCPFHHILQPKWPWRYFDTSHKHVSHYKSLLRFNNDG